MRQIQLLAMTAITMIALVLLSSLAFAQNVSSESQIVSTQPGGIPRYESCIDSDGTNIFNYGYITEEATNWGITLDTCVDSTTVEERVCVDGKGANIYKTCQNGCVNGACIKSEITSCKIPMCEGAHPTGEYYPDGCPKFECTTSNFVKLNQKFSLKPQESVIVQNYKKMQIKSLGKVQVACKVEILCDADNCIQPVCFTKYVGLDIFMPDKHQITSSSIMHLGVGEEKEIYDVFIHLVELDEDGVALLYVRTKNIDSHPIPINTTIPRNKATLFDGASWQCYGHDGISTGTISETCQTSEYWQKLAENSCNDVCNPVLGKCGVNSFTVGESCKKAVKGKPTEVIGVKITPLPDYKDPVVSPACTGCNKDDKCYPIGYRQSGEFCSHVDVFKVQLGSDSACDNNFECSSNVCVANKCVSPSMLENIFSWFKKTPWKN